MAEKYMEPGTVVEIDAGGLMTRAEVITDYGGAVHCRILEHYYKDQQGTFRTYKKADIWRVERGTE